MSQPEFAPETPRRILVRSPNWLGDAVMSMPAIVRLRQTFAQSCIAVLTPAKLAELWLHQAAVDQVLAFNPGDSLFWVARKLRFGQFDIAIVLPNSPRSAIEPWLAGIPIRVGYARPWRNLFLTVRIQSRPEAYRVRKRARRQIKRLIAHPIDNTTGPTLQLESHQVYDYLHLISRLGAEPDPVAPTLAVPETEKETFAKRFLVRPGTGLSPDLNLAAIAPGAEYGPAKRWPVERFVAVADEISNRTGCRWMIFGGPADVQIAGEIAAGVPTAVNLCGRTSLTELIAGLALCRVLLANDSGAAHVGAAVGTPVVVPFGSTDPRLTGPGLPGDKRHRFLTAAVPCAPCFRRTCPIDHRCMKSISVEQVTNAVLAAGFGCGSS